MPRKPSLWLVHDGDETAHFVIARDCDEAIRLFVAATGFDDPRQLRAETPSWQLVSPEPSFPTRVIGVPTRVIGVWAPDASIIAGYGLCPGEDYQECECCGLVLPEEDFADDSSVCCGCVEPRGDALAGGTP